MKISARASGGFSGQAEQLEVDTSRVSHGRTLETLLQDMDFFTAAPAPQAGADIARWEITVEDGHRRHSVTFAEDGSAEAAPWQSLIAQLRHTA